MRNRFDRAAGRQRGGAFTVLLLWLPLAYVVGVYLVTSLIPPPGLVGARSVAFDAETVEWLVDESWIDRSGERRLEQSILDAVLSMVDAADSLIVLDLFLFTDWQGPVQETHRDLSAELTQALIDRQQSPSPPSIVLISDPINTVYGGLPSTHIDALTAAGIRVVLTDLTRLQDSNPLYSSVWRWFIRPFGNARADTLPNPFGPGRVSLRSYLALANFKANHRKLVIADDDSGTLQGLVTSANPHDGSSAHRNTALRFTGAAVAELLHNEFSLLRLSGAGRRQGRSVDVLPVRARHHQRLDRCACTPSAGAHPARRQQRCLRPAEERRTEQAGRRRAVSRGCTGALVRYRR